MSLICELESSAVLPITGVLTMGQLQAALFDTTGRQLVMIGSRRGDAFKVFWFKVTSVTRLDQAGDEWEFVGFSSRSAKYRCRYSMVTLKGTMQSED